MKYINMVISNPLSADSCAEDSPWLRLTRCSFFWQLISTNSRLPELSAKSMEYFFRVASRDRPIYNFSDIFPDI